MIYRIAKFILSPIIRLIWIKEVEGLENVPKKGAFVIAANHLSLADPFFLVSVVPRMIFFIAGEKFYRSRCLSWALNSCGQIPVQRKAKDKSATYAAIDVVLKKGECFGIFPEGTRSRSGKIQKAYVGVARIALNSKVDIVPAVIVGAYEIMPPGKNWPRFKKLARIKILEPIKYSSFKDLTPEQITHTVLMPKIARELGEEYRFEADEAHL